MPVPTEPSPPPFDQANPKAAAKAAKAYAKAARPWYRKKRFWLLGIVVVVVIIVIATQAGGGGGGNSTAGNNAGQPTTQGTQGAQHNPGTGPSTQLPMQDGDWRLDSIQLKDDGTGDFGAVTRITYTGQDTSGGNNIFTVTVFNAQGHTIVATLTGGANDVLPGHTVTGQMISTDTYRAGNLPFTFQKQI